MAYMINRRTTLLSGFACASLWALTRSAAAQLSAQDQADLQRIQAYLNSIRSLKARFVQTAADGATASGIALMQRPGKMRFQYDPPTPYLLVANHGILTFVDGQLAQTSRIPLGQTPLGILLANQVQLTGDVTVERLLRLPGQLQLTLYRTANPGEGNLTLIFADNPLTLRQWIVQDQQGKQTRVAFANMDVGVSIDASLFEHEDVPISPGGSSGG